MTATLQLPRPLVYDRLVLDKGSARRKDDNGFLHVSDCNISKAQVRQYYGGEIQAMTDKPLNLVSDKVYGMLCSAEELKKAAPSFANMPLLYSHKPISAEILADDKEKRKLIVGSLGTDVHFSNPYLKADIVVYAADAIQGIEDEAQRELSCGYRFDPVMDAGSLDGEAYDGVMKDISGNHVALVVEGRAGHDVTVSDEKPKTPHVDLKAVVKQIADALRPVEGAYRKLGEAMMAATTEHRNKWAGVGDAVATYQMPKAGAVKEHTRLVKVLESPSHEDDKKEAQLQAKELNEKIKDSITKREDVNPKAGVKEYGTVTFGDPKNKKYPLDTEAHVRAALSYWGQEKNKSMYGKEDQTTIGNRIEQAAKKFKLGKYADKGK